MEPTKRGKLKTILIIAILVVLTIIIAILVYFWKENNQNPIETIKNLVKDGSFTGTNEDSEGNPSDSSGDDTPIWYSGSSSGGGGGDTINPETGCIRSAIPYSITQGNTEQTCNLYLEDACIGKTITCSVNITNLDQSSLKGYFSIDVSFKNNQDNTILKISNSNFIIDPGSFESIKEELNLSGEDASKEISCYFNTAGLLPYKEVC